MDNWVKWPEPESDHKPLYSMELTCGAIILCLYMNEAFKWLQH